MAPVKTTSADAAYDVVCFAVIDWDFRWQRPQQLMMRFAAEGHRVFFLSPTRFAPFSVPFSAHDLAPEIREIRLSLTRPFDVYGEGVGPESVKLAVDSLAALRDHFDIKRAVSIIEIPSWQRAARAARDHFDWPIVYDCMDDWQSFPGIGTALRSEEPRLVRDADGVIVSAEKLRKAWATHNPNTVLARNAADFDFFHNPSSQKKLLPGLQRPILGYFGAIASWFAVDLLAHVARSRPHYSFVLLGGVFDVDVAALEVLPNVHLLGQQPYEKMPAYLSEFDVCLVPFDTSPATESMDVVKFYEYISQGKPVVSTPLPEIEIYRDYLYLAGDAPSFLTAVDAAVAENDPELRRRRIDLARQNSWQARLDAIRPVIDRAFSRRHEVELLKLESEAKLPSAGSEGEALLERITSEVRSSDDAPTVLRRIVDDLLEQRASVEILANRYAALERERAILAEGIEFLKKERTARDERIAFLEREQESLGDIIKPDHQAIANADEQKSLLEQVRARLVFLQREAAALRNVVGQRDGAIEYLEREAASLRDIVKQRDEAVAYLDQQRAHAVAQLDAIRAELEAQKQITVLMRDEVRRVEDDVARLASENEGLHGEIEKRDSQITLRDAQLERIEQRSKEQLEGIEWLRGEVATRDQRVAELEGKLEGIYQSKLWKTAAIYWRGRSAAARAVRPLTAPRKAALTVGRKLLPNNAKRFLKKFWDPNQTISPQEAVVLRAADVAGLPSQPLKRAPITYDVICFSIIDWDFRWQRPQQIMSQFANEGHRVFFFKTTECLISDQKYRIRELRENVWEVQLGMPRHIDVYGGTIADDLLARLMEDLRQLRDDFHITCALSVVQIATWASAAFAARDRFGWRVAYDCMDEWDTFPGLKPAMIESEQRLVSDGDVLVVSAQRLLEKFQGKAHSIVLARNATNFEHFHNPPPNDLLQDVSQPIVGYFGAIADWFDLPLMLRLAKERPQYTFVLLGGVFGVDTSELERLPNVRILGQKPYPLMPAYLQHFDACIIPFVVNAVTEATDPVKFYEYVSQGKPVVAPRMPELYPYAEYLYIADNHDDFLRKVDAAVSENDEELRERRIELARQNTWEARLASIKAKVTEAHPKVSIAIVTYHNVEVTKLCLDSVFRNTVWPNYEVIIVDNASADTTPDYLRELEANHDNVRIILNDTNRGFAGANNQALEIATGDVLVLLNNDTVVPNGWLPKLLRHLSDPEIGLVVTVTNFSGNESRIEVPYKNLEEMEEFAEKYTREHEDQLFDIAVAAMYCVAMRRDTFEKVGPLDERFSVGMFEDDDYSHRMRLAGLRVVCVEDTFVHHFGQASFKKLSTSEYQAVWDRNQRLYEQKWGRTWEAHKPRPRPST